MVKGSYTFTHNSTSFPLVGQHQSATCKACHAVLDFSKATSECVACHTDMHQQTVGSDCATCHTPKSWLVENITRMHQESRFPLMGAHATADCFQCHASASLLRFDPLGTDCYDCHQIDYQRAKEPEHVNDADFSTDCVLCHAMNAFAWKGAGISHLFFPLYQGHELSDCFACHPKEQKYSSIRGIECVACHLADYQSTTNPNHTSSGFSENCAECHTNSRGWKPARMESHDAEYFPIYSGNHNGEWDNCSTCHTIQGDFKSFSCTDCHTHSQSKTNRKHSDVVDYEYNSNACYDCHPNGQKGDK